MTPASLKPGPIRGSPAGSRLIQGSFVFLLRTPTRELGVEAALLFCWINSSRRVVRIDYRAPPGNDVRGINPLSSLSIQPNASFGEKVTRLFYACDLWE